MNYNIDKFLILKKKQGEGNYIFFSILKNMKKQAKKYHIMIQIDNIPHCCYYFYYNIER